MLESIKQKPVGPAASGLPDFRNLGVILRVLLAVNLLALLTVAIRVDELSRLAGEFALMAGRVEFALLVAVVLLYLGTPAMRGLSPLPAHATVFGVVTLATVAGEWLAAPSSGVLVRPLGWAWLATALCLAYFDWRSRRLSPALAEARLMALTARIRPHFFFNSLNGVLGVIRSEPRRAERALEELADLFRALMQDGRERVSLAEEVELAERYVDLERLRLGERLAVRWVFADAAVADDDAREALLCARVPSLMLQPLLENAVYHGIEPAADAGEVVVRIARRSAELWIEVDNPVSPTGTHHAGNRIALDNIRERLMLFHDLEARLEIDESGGRYRVRIRLPFDTETR
jgi:two-component system sensor histidine kinase AlgZ